MIIFIDYYLWFQDYFYSSLLNFIEDLLIFTNSIDGDVTVVNFLNFTKTSLNLHNPAQSKVISKIIFPLIFNFDWHWIIRYLNDINYFMSVLCVSVIFMSVKEAIGWIFALNLHLLFIFIWSFIISYQLKINKTHFKVFIDFLSIIITFLAYSSIFHSH